MMNKSNGGYFYVGIGVVAIGLLWLGGVFTQSDNSELAISQGRLVSPEDKFDFGEVKMTEGLVKHSFSLVNEGNEVIEIGKVYTSCMCTEAYVAGQGPFGMPGHGGLARVGAVVAPGETVEVEAVFDPAAHGPAGAGLAERVIYLETNSEVTPKVAVGFRALVVR